MPHLSWNEVRDRAIRFSREHAQDRSERAERQTFLNDFFHVFGLRRASIASFEENVRNLQGNVAAIDLLWKGKLLVEHKSFGEDLSLAATQAFTYIEDLTRAQRWDEIPRYVLVSDFARFVLYDLEPEEQRDLPLFDGSPIAPHHFTLAEFHRSPSRARGFRHALRVGPSRAGWKPARILAPGTTRRPRAQIGLRPGRGAGKSAHVLLASEPPLPRRFRHERPRAVDRLPTSAGWSARAMAWRKPSAA